jgi:hypothetical protein
LISYKFIHYYFYLIEDGNYQGCFQFFDVMNLEKFIQKIAKLVDWIECYYQCHQNPQIPSFSFTIVQEKVATLLRHAQQAVFLSFFAI